MKTKIMLLALSLAGTASFGQKADNVQQAFTRLAEKLGNAKVLSYDSEREINNPKNDYFRKNTGSLYFEFEDRSSPLLRTQLTSEDYLQVYNGTEYFTLDQKKKVSTVEKANLKVLSSVSLMYHSMPTLRLVLPLVIKDNTIPKQVIDTVVDSKALTVLKFTLQSKVINFPEAFLTFDTDGRYFYEIFVDKISWLPVMVEERNSISEGYIVRTTFKNVNLDPKAPDALSWNFSAYKGYELEKKPAQKPLIAVGSILTDWSLPVFAAKGGQTVKGADLKGKLTVMEFWIKNCGYCMEAFPVIKEFQQKYGSDKLQILSINAYDSDKEIDFFYKREQPKYKMLYKGEALANAIGIYAYPGTIILNGEGKIVYASRGFDKEAVEKVIKSAAHP